MRLSELKNIGGVSVRWLREVGVDSVERLAEEDVFELWVKIKKLHPKEVSMNLLWALEGAMLDLDWKDLPPKRKKELEGKLKKWEEKRDPSVF